MHTFFRNFKALQIVLQQEIFTFIGVNTTETLFRFLDLWSKVSPHFTSSMAVERVVTFTSLNERLPDFRFFDQVALLGSCPHYLGLVLSPINFLWVELAGKGQNRARESSAQRSRWYSTHLPSLLLSSTDMPTPT